PKSSNVSCTFSSALAILSRYRGTTSSRICWAMQASGAAVFGEEFKGNLLLVCCELAPQPYFGEHFNSGRVPRGELVYNWCIMTVGMHKPYYPVGVVAQLFGLLPSALPQNLTGAFGS